MFRIFVAAFALAVLFCSQPLRATEYTFHQLFSNAAGFTVDPQILPPQLDASGAAYFSALNYDMFDAAIVRATPEGYTFLDVTSNPDFSYFQSVNAAGDVVAFNDIGSLGQQSLTRISGGVSTDVPLPTATPFHLQYSAGVSKAYSTALINDHGVVAYTGVGPGGQLALYSSEHPEVTLVSTSAAGPIYVAYSFEGTNLFPANFGMNNSGDIFFVANGAQGGGIYSVSLDGVLTARLLPTDMNLWPLIEANDNGSILFLADSSTDRRLYQLSPGGQPVPVTPLLSDYRTTFDINNQGEIAYGQLDAKESIFAGPASSLEKVIEEGDTLDGQTVLGLRFYQGLNDSGQIAFLANLSEQGWVAYRADPAIVPEPSTLALAVVGGLAWLSCAPRRRSR